jgi:outer membrane receptor protein involved in Fe transport
VLRIVLLLALAALAMAQTETGQVTGSVFDPTGAVVPKATVVLKSLSTGLVRQIESNDAGVFIFSSLQPGEYELTAAASGFSKSSRKVVVTVGSKIGADMHLEIGRPETVVQVTETAGQINTETQTLSTVINQQGIAELPSLTRNPYDFVGTAGNVTAMASFGRGAGYTINGLRSASTNVLLDGAANNDEFVAAYGMAVPLDSVQEFSVLTNNFTAEFGRATGGVVNVLTKSGTNEFHGSVYEFNRVSRLAANSPDNNANEIRKSVFARNQFGYSVGGPIKKDKLFFFQNTEWIRIRSASTSIVYVPTAQLIAASAAATRDYFSALGDLKPDIVRYETLTKSDLAARGVNICGGAAAGGPCNSLPGTTPMFTRVAYNVAADSGGGAPRNELQLVGRMDYNRSEKTQIYGRYAIQHQNLFVGTVGESPYAGYDTGQRFRGQSYLLSLVRAFSPTLVSQSKAVFNRFNSLQPLGEKPVTPTLYFNPNSGQALLGNWMALPGYLPYTPGSGIPFGGPQNFIQLYHDVSWTKGRHQVRFGGSYTYLRDNRSFGAYQEPVMALNTTTAWGKSIDNLLLGQVQRFNGAVSPQGKFPCDDAAHPTAACTLTLPVGPPDFTRSNRYHEFGLYGQDSWKVTRNLTLNLGLRWEYFGVQHNKDPKLDSNYYDGTSGSIQQRIRDGDMLVAPDSPIGGLWVKHWRNFAPRLGFAWDIFGDGKTSLRGGYSIGYERNFGNVTFNVIQNPPAYAVVSLTAGVDVPTIAITTNPSGPLAGTSGTKAMPATSGRNVDSNLKQARAQTWSASLERELRTNVVVGIDYSASKGSNLYGIANYNMNGAGNVYLGDPCTTGDPFSCTARLKRTRYTSINRRDSEGTSIYNGLNTRLELRNLRSTGLTLRVNWTWAHAIDTLSSTFSESGGGAGDSNNGTNLGYLDPFNPNLDRGNAEFDTRHRLAISGVWEVPLAKNSKGAVKHILNGWELVPIMTMRTGAPFSLFDSTNAYYWATMRAVFDGSVPLTGNSNGPAEGTPNRIIYYDWRAAAINSDYVHPITGTSEFGPWPAGMTARDAFRGPGVWYIDLGIYKNFKITERIGMQFRGEFYNLLNHSNLYAITGDSDVASYGSGYMTAERADQRNVQLALRITF